jgi:5-methylcytosine-specific restriction endonuclease McrA
MTTAIEREMRLAAAYAALSRCMYCGSAGGGDIDHIVPAVRGGSDLVRQRQPAQHQPYDPASQLQRIS